MHSIFSRINNISAFLSSCMMALLAAVALSTFVFTATPQGDLAISSIKVVSSNARRYPNKKQDLAFVHFNITAATFLYLEAEYSNSQGVKNEVVVWDRIVRRKEDAFIKFVGKNKYMFRDVSSSFKNVPPANYSLKYNVMPYVGVLTYGEAAKTSEAIAFPPTQSRL
ncbi:signal peptidase 22kDa subunit [Flammula alnicola]|nr:signal peptidase 22kDa subunit [Flammula alnicola]